MSNKVLSCLETKLERFVCGTYELEGVSGNTQFLAILKGLYMLKAQSLNCGFRIETLCPAGM
jgi:hypothetical protein